MTIAEHSKEASSCSITIRFLQHNKYILAAIMIVINIVAPIIEIWQKSIYGIQQLILPGCRSIR